MKNKNLIKKIKKSVINQFEADLKNSVLKELYGNASKKELKKLKKQILKEVQKDLFGSQSKSREESLKNQLDMLSDSVDTMQKEIKEAPVVEEPKVEEKTTHNYRGFEFDVRRMSEMVTGKKRPDVPYIPQEGERAQDISEAFIKDDAKKKMSSEIKNPVPPEITKPTPEFYDNELKKINEIKPRQVEKEKIDMLKDILKHSKTINSTINKPGFNVPTPTTITNIPGRSYGLKTPSQKEDLIFFIGKLKEGVSKLSKGEKNINYRLRKDDRYIFDYSRYKSDSNDFTLNFSIELNVNTGAAKIENFYFEIDRFTFDASFFEVLDVVKVLDLIGFNINKYVNEITQISGRYTKKTGPGSEYSESINHDEIKKPTIKPSRVLDKGVKLSDIIDDKRLLRLLRYNDVVTYGDYQRVEDLTSLKGIGSKTAEKISDIVDRYLENRII